MKLVSATEMLNDAKKRRYAIGHFNINNMESMKAFLLAAQEGKSPIILGISGEMARYMGGYRTISHLAQDLIDFFKISVPVTLHADHGNYEEAIDAINNGFSSVMFDGSKYSITENIKKTREIVNLAHSKGISVEAEVGAIGGKKESIIEMGECANPEECAQIANLGIDFLAAGIGNVHGIYPENWIGLNFDLLAKIQKHTNGMPLVLHGGSGIPTNMIRKSIKLGICKINVNTECQMAFTKAIKKYFDEKKDLLNQGYAIRSVLAPGVEEVKKVCTEKMRLFGSLGKA